MLARKIVAFLWGGALASAWWAAATFGHGSPEAKLLWVPAVAATILSVCFATCILGDHWDK